MSIFPYLIGTNATDADTSLDSSTATTKWLMAPLAIFPWKRKSPLLAALDKVELRVIHVGAVVLFSSYGKRRCAAKQVVPFEDECNHGQLGQHVLMLTKPGTPNLILKLC